MSFGDSVARRTDIVLWWIEQVFIAVFAFAQLRATRRQSGL